LHFPVLIFFEKRMNMFVRFRFAPLFILLATIPVSSAQSQDQGRAYEQLSREILSGDLQLCNSYRILKELVTVAPHRLSGSDGAARAVAWGAAALKESGADSTWLEPVMVPHWERGDVEECQLLLPGSDSVRNLSICALGGSIGTPTGGVEGEIFEVQSFEELAAHPEMARGKIIFFNRSMDRTKLSTGEAYGGAVGQRSQGAIQAAKAGGIAAIVRSMTTRMDDIPHAGAMNYVDTIPKVPAAAVSTIGAGILSDALRRDPHTKVRLRLSAKIHPDVESANVIGEIRGSEHPEEVILIGGHLDAWDKGEGAHDDGAGCAQVVDVIRILRSHNLVPRRTIRAVLFMNEENGLRGGKAYAERERPGEKLIAALETDAGGLSPRGFGVTADSSVFRKIASFGYLFSSIDADHVRPGGGGADISPLAGKTIAMLALRVDGQKYFDYHHSDNDTFDKVNERELQLGASMIAVLVYVIAQEGL
jgi:hypothetical protein